MTCKTFTLISTEKRKKKTNPKTPQHCALQTDTQKVTQCCNFESIQIPCETFSENYLKKRQVLKSKLQDELYK